MSERSFRLPKDFKIPSKKNSYVVRIAKGFWPLIQQYAGEYRRKSRGAPWWIGPSTEVIKAQEAVGWVARARGIRVLDGPVKLEIAITKDGVRVAVSKSQVKKVGRSDLDNLLGVLCDGLEGVAFHNDRQISEIQIFCEDSKESA